MTEFLGSRISLISKRDIRYVGTLHEISSENSTVALEQVVSYGTEGRRPDDEVPSSDNVYEYIVFRGSDVKDLRIEEGPKENNPPKPPQVPDDPAILNSARKPASTPQAPLQNQAQQNSQPPPQAQQHRQPQAAPSFQPNQQQPPFPHPGAYPPPNQRFVPHGFPPGPGMPYGPPPGWYPPPGQGFPHPPPNQFYHQGPIGPPPQQRQQAPQPQPAAPIGPAAKMESDLATQSQSPTKPTATVKLPSATSTPNPPVLAQNGPPPPTESKPDVAAALAPPASVATRANPATTKTVPSGPKSGRIIPAVPLASPSVKPSATVTGPLQSSSGNITAPTASQAAPQPATARSSQVASKSVEEANRDARAAVAAAMAKLPPAPGQKKQTNGEGAMDNLTKKVNEMRMNDNIRTSKQPGTGGYAAGYRGGRGTHRGGRPHADQQSKKVEVPNTDYDFESANAKFNKQDLVKEAIASGSPTAASGDDTTVNGSTEDPFQRMRKASEPSVDLSSGVGYNRSSSFFDNISSESKDREGDGGKKLGGREFRNEERQKNLETFGQGSVDNNYRGGYRGRGRGRGFGRGRGGYGGRGARGSSRGGRGAISADT